MLVNYFHQAVASARSNDSLDAILKMLWTANLKGEIGDSDAQAVSDVAYDRRAAFRSPHGPVRLGQTAAVRAPRRAPRSPDRAASLIRRRRCAACGALPPALAAHFTSGEVAALSIVAQEVRKSGQCVASIDALAAMAGVSRTTFQNAVRAAIRLGLIERIERRRRGTLSLTNILRIPSREWQAWMRHGERGLKKMSATDSQLLQKRKNDVSERPLRPVAAPWSPLWRKESPPPSDIRKAAAPESPSVGTSQEQIGDSS